MKNKVSHVKSIKSASLKNVSTSNISEQNYVNPAKNYQEKISSSTSNMVVADSYGLFVTDSGFKTGSYSVTSNHNAYKALNLALSSKSNR